MKKTVNKYYMLRLLSGHHREHDPETNACKKYVENDTVKSVYPLHKRFANKFQLLEVIKETEEIEDTKQAAATRASAPAPARRRRRKRARVIEPKEEPEELPEEEEVELDEFEPAEKLKPVHRGGGRYIVFNEITKKPVHEGTLSKADAFNLAGLEVPK